ncbi:MAG: hypothetical protein CVV33_06045 [Methanomicrobiales archaeon HGW-Methanomicrobiales-4]|nr:MAG: hypothetical protein CVV33_06045 [Methanomicrobiales archaeon HGW-Methanomicrobiales-4]
MTDGIPETRFICDRMAGSLCRYLRLMGYDTFSANDLPPGDRKEDTHLLMIAHKEERILLTRDAELTQRDRERVLYLTSNNSEEQIRQIFDAGLIDPVLRLTRCSLCNSLLKRIDPEDILSVTGEIPDFCPKGKVVFWCPQCRKIYWEGSHTRSMQSRIDKCANKSGIPK